jgi:hypothetical protein
VIPTAALQPPNHVVLRSPFEHSAPVESSLFHWQGIVREWCVLPSPDWYCTAVCDIHSSATSTDQQKAQNDTDWLSQNCDPKPIVNSEPRTKVTARMPV